MDKNKTIIIVLVIVIIALAALICGFFFMNNSGNDVVIYNNTIDDVGTFNTTNVTNFTLDESYDDGATHYTANYTGAQIIVTSSSALIENTKVDADRINDSAEGHSIYKNTANVGEYKGEVRYFSILTDNDNERYVYISSPDFNLTCMMVDSFKMF
ncbi:MAG: hypothetical protein IJ287_08075 [Methanobrevibacter sp.]|nr:hypothetical protein [Methanobrevibacter sp.]